MDLLGLVKEQFTSSIVSKISSFLGESTENTYSAIESALPAILGGVMQNASTTQGVSDLLSTIRTGGYDGGVLNNLGGLLDDIKSTSTLASLGSGFLGSIFGDKLGALSSFISNTSSIKTGSASSLLGLVAPILMNVLGKKVITQGLSTSGLASLLMSQKNAVKAALPTGIGSILNIEDLGDFSGNPKSTVVNNFKQQTNDKKPKSWLPLLLLAGLLLGAIYYWKSCRNVDTVVVEDTTTEAVANIDSAATEVIGSLKKTLSTGIELNFGEESIENELISFIEDKSKPVDKTTWFNFRDLRFETGSAVIDSTSMQEVRNIAEILKAYPIDLKIGGYTDNVGKEAVNQKLSADRATSVVKALVAMGIDAKRLDPEGYGSQFPVASNDTEEGKAQNRRIAVRVTKK
ncbi:DUF937 domain-containing protein [Emticicia sp. W12TSBA100-4]|uniref:DUF937 domain-containing protein n=1 Tax=Emticicia sp. W12TSBA100-4 TaxID=3160965 RepID=UPI003305EDEB